MTQLRLATIGVAAIALLAENLLFAQSAAPAFEGTALTAAPTDAWPTNGGEW
jgi:hypothetical protein